MRLNVSNREMERLFADLPVATKRATANTLNKVIRKANRNLKKYVTGNYNVPARSLKLGGLISIKRADARRNIGKATIIIRKVGRGLFKFSPKQDIGGYVSVKIKKTRKTVRGSFISVWRKGQSAQFVFRRDKSAGLVTRRSKAGKTYQAQRRRSLFGPKIADLYTSRAAGRVLDKTIEDNFQTMLDAEFNRQVERKRR